MLRGLHTVNLTFEYAVRKAQLELTNGFVAQGSKVLSAFTDDMDTVTQSTKAIFTFHENKTREIGLKSSKIKPSTKKPRSRIEQNISMNDYNFEVIKEFEYLKTWHVTNY